MSTTTPPDEVRMASGNRNLFKEKDELLGDLIIPV
jgi:hypothetical protein